ncbi:hypothetical protein [Rhodococcus triatomae]
MTPDHAALMAELRSLALAALDRLEPILERAAQGVTEHSGDTTGHVAESDTDRAGPAPEAEAGTSAGASGCSWCPVCALVALVKGEPHDLVTLIGSQIAALLALLRALLAEHDGQGGPGGGGAGSDGGQQTTRTRAFVPIQVRIEDNPES